MKTIFSFFFLCISFFSFSQPHAEPIVFAHIDSHILKEKRTVWVYTPSYDIVFFTKSKYPVLYVLDGDSYFLSLVTMIKQLSENGNTVLPEMIIVGVLNSPGNRTRDLTPTKSPSIQSSGGGENFIRFMQSELIPYIDKKYATAPYRILMGHSLGGLTVINTFLKHTNFFNAYVATDPSMFYDNDRLLTETKTSIKNKNFRGSSLFLGIANTMSPGMDTNTVRKDTTSNSHHIRSIIRFLDYLKSSSVKGLNWKSVYYENDDHHSVQHIAQYDALRFIFSDNKFPDRKPDNQFDQSYAVDNIKRDVVKHYNLMSEQRGYPVLPPEPYYNQLGYNFLQQKEFDKAYLFFQLNMTFFPKSFNVYDSMGDYYLSRNDKVNAKKNFEKALSLKFKPDIQEKLKKLKL